MYFLKRELFVLVSVAGSLLIGDHHVVFASDAKPRAPLENSGEQVPAMAGEAGEAGSRDVRFRMIPTPKPAPPLEVCTLPALRLLALEPSTRRAVVREGTEAPRIVRPGSSLAGTWGIVREVGGDKLVVDVLGEGQTTLARLWILVPEHRGDRSRATCFLPLRLGPPPKRGDLETGSER